MNETKPTLSIITVSYGDSAHIGRLLSSLQSYAGDLAWEFVVVDNNSPHQDSQKLEDILRTDPRTHLIKLRKNLGFGEGNREGVQFSHGDTLAFINPDIEVQSGCLDKLITELQRDDKIGITTPQLQTRDGKTLENTWDFPSVWSLLRKRLSSPAKDSASSLPHSPTSVEWAQGSFLVLRKSLYRQLNGFDPQFFLFFEDTDLCRRTWELGKKVVQIPQAKAFHSAHRLSGNDILTSLFRRTFWIHVSSAVKYFLKWKGKKTPTIF